MIVYFDTSDVVKLYVEEERSDGVRTLLKDTDVAVTSCITYVEAIAAFSRRFNHSRAKHIYRAISDAFKSDWDNYFSMNIDRELIKEAAKLAEKHNLRAYDSIHLASAILLRRGLKRSVIFSSSNNELNSSALKEKLVVMSS